MNFMVMLDQSRHAIDREVQKYTLKARGNHEHGFGVIDTTEERTHAMCPP